MSTSQSAQAVGWLPEKSSSKRVAWLLAGLATMAGVLYYETAARLVRNWWEDPNYSHGFIVPAFSAIILWHNGSRLRALPLEPSWFGLLVSTGALLMLVVGKLGSEQFLANCSLLFLAAGMVIFFFGWAHFRAILFPWFVLFFMVPVPAIIFNEIALPLQLLASEVGSWVLPIFKVPVLREGNLIHLPAVTLEVAQACSGIRSLVSLLTVALVLGYVGRSGAVDRVLLALVAIPVSIIANAFRIVGTGVLVYYWSPEKALGFFHEFSGWLLFIVSLLLLGLFQMLLRLRHQRTQKSE